MKRTKVTLNIEQRLNMSVLQARAIGGIEEATRFFILRCEVGEKGCHNWVLNKATFLLLLFLFDFQE